MLVGARGRSDLQPLFPGDPEVPAGEEAGNGVPSEVVDPALGTQLGHDGVNEGVASLALVWGVGVRWGRGDILGRGSEDLGLITKGNTSLQVRRCWGLSSQSTCRQTGLPTIRSKLGMLAPAV